MTAISHRLAVLPPLACGPTPEDAARAFSETKWPDATVEFHGVEEADEVDPTFRVRGRVHHTGHGWTSIKIDGVKVSGGYVVTEWV